jgi:hypothetical protein
LEKLAAGEGFSFPPLFYLSFVAPAAHRTSFAPGSRPRRLGDLRPCPPECRPSSPPPPNSANAASPPSIYSSVASLQGKKVVASSFPSSPCTWLCVHGEPSPLAAPLAMAASSLAGPCPCGHGHVCFCPCIMFSLLACQFKAHSVISLAAAARRRAIVRHRPRHLVAVACDVSPPSCLCAHALQLRIAAARTWFGRREPPLGLKPVKWRCLQATRAVRSPANGSDQIGVYPFGVVHRGPVHRVHRSHSRWIEDPWLNQAAFFYEPLSFHEFTCRSFHLSRFLQISPRFYELAPVFSVQ